MQKAIWVVLWEKDKSKYYIFVLHLFFDSGFYRIHLMNKKGDTSKGSGSLLWKMKSSGRRD